MIGWSGLAGMDDVRCDGDEAELTHCPSAGWGNNNCVHDEDVGVNTLDPGP